MMRPFQEFLKVFCHVTVRSATLIKDTICLHSRDEPRLHFRGEAKYDTGESLPLAICNRCTEMQQLC